MEIQQRWAFFSGISLGNDTLLWVSTGKLGLIPLFDMKHQQSSKCFFSAQRRRDHVQFFTFTDGLSFFNCSSEYLTTETFSSYNHRTLATINIVPGTQHDEFS